MIDLFPPTPIELAKRYLEQQADLAMRRTGLKDRIGAAYIIMGWSARLPKPTPNSPCDS